MMDQMDVYNHLPLYLQNMVCSLEGRRIQRKRYSKEFHIFLSDYRNRNEWSYDQLCEYRDERLRRMVKHCYESVEYYNKIFNESGVHYKNIKRLDDLKKIPILDKETVLQNYEQFIAKNISRRQMVTAHTSGTTGSGFVFYTLENALRKQWAVWWRYRMNLGITFDSYCAFFGGRSVVPVKQKKAPFSRINMPCKQEYFSTYHISDRNIEWYVQELNRKQYPWIHGYPSAISLIADYILEKGRKLDYQVRFVTTGAENLLQPQKEKIRRAFGVYPYNHYGMSEGVANFSENLSKQMKVDEDFAAVEFCRIPDTGETEVVGTSLNNFAMPLLRYRTKDIATCMETKEGRIIKSIDGRKEDYIQLKDGRKIGRLDHIFKDMVHVKEAQIYQKNNNEIDIRIIKGKGYREEDERKLMKEASLRMADVRLRIVYVDKIARSEGGKLRFVISDI